MNSNSGDAEAIKNVITKAYIEGIFIKQDESALKSGFHSQFEMFIFENDDIKKMDVDSWIPALKKLLAKDPTILDGELTYNFTDITIAKWAASVRLDMYRDGNHFTTDFFHLYKFSDGWKVVAKSYAEE
jgi:hypothetical protein